MTLSLAEQARNVANAGRYGDSVLLHLNRAELNGIASLLPITIHPQTGMAEAFLPFLAAAAAPALLGGGMGAAGLAGLGLAGGLAGGLMQGAMEGDIGRGLKQGLMAGALGGIGGGIAGLASGAGAGLGAAGAAGAAAPSAAAAPAAAMAPTASTATNLGAAGAAGGGAGAAFNPATAAAVGAGPAAGAAPGAGLASKGIGSLLGGSTGKILSAAAPAALSMMSGGFGGGGGPGKKAGVPGRRMTVSRGFTGGPADPMGRERRYFTQPTYEEREEDDGYRHGGMVHRYRDGGMISRYEGGGRVAEQDVNRGIFNTPTTTAPTGPVVTPQPTPSPISAPVTRDPGSFVSGGIASMGDQASGMGGFNSIFNRSRMFRGDPMGQAPQRVPFSAYGSRFFQPQYRHGGMVKYQEGGIASMMAEPQKSEDPVVAEAVLAIRGQHPDPKMAIKNFIMKYGPEAFESLMSQVTQESDGLSDSVPAVNPDGRPAALSEGEYVVPSDAVSGLGNGSSEAGGRALDSMVSQIRGSRKQPQVPAQIDPEQVMPV